jgi:hypothetical protein
MLPAVQLIAVITAPLAAETDASAALILSISVVPPAVP